MNLVKEKKYIDEYVNLTGDLLSDELVKSMKQYRHHQDTNTHFHSVYVSYTVLKICEALEVINTREIVRASLLHDFYLYQWYTEKHEEYHIWYHPKESVKNIEKHFGALTDIQRNMILSHMFPTCVELPKSKGAWILTLADKKCALDDYITKSKNFFGVYNEIEKRIK
jgi:uncharacterized protein